MVLAPIVLCTSMFYLNSTIASPLPDKVETNIKTRNGEDNGRSEIKKSTIDKVNAPVLITGVEYKEPDGVNVEKQDTHAETNDDERKGVNNDLKDNLTTTTHQISSIENKVIAVKDVSISQKVDTSDKKLILDKDKKQDQLKITDGINNQDTQDQPLSEKLKKDDAKQHTNLDVKPNIVSTIAADDKQNIQLTNGAQSESGMQKDKLAAARRETVGRKLADNEAKSQNVSITKYQKDNQDAAKIISEDINRKTDEADFSNFFVNFDKSKILDFDYNMTTYNNLSLIENDEELKWIKQTIMEYRDPILKRKRESLERYSTSSDDSSWTAQTIEKSIHVSSLVYFNKNDWSVTINGKKITNNTKGDYIFFEAKVVKVNKTSVVFLLTNAEEKITKKVRLIQNNKSSYGQNYYLMHEGGKTYVAFKLFIGQKINLDTMKITG